MPIEKESRKWLVPCSLRMSENVEILEKTAKILKNPKDRHEEDGACSWDKEINLIINHMPKMKIITPYNRTTHVPKSTEKERYEMCWGPHTAGGNLMLHSGIHFRRQNVDSFYTRAIQRHSGSKTSYEFLLAEDPRVRLCERAQPHRSREVRGTIERKELVSGGFDQNKFTSNSLHVRQTLGQNQTIPSSQTL